MVLPSGKCRDFFSKIQIVFKSYGLIFFLNIKLKISFLMSVNLNFYG